MTPDPITILVAEGDAVLRGGTGLLLGKAGYVVREAAGGEAALASMAASVPDLLLLDRDLPDLDGLEVCRRVKADATARDCFVLLASGSSVAPEEPAEGLEAGADGYIARPVANRELLARIDAYVRIIRLRKTLRLQNEALVRTSEAAAAARSSSLKLTEDAVAARERVEALNRVLLYEISERKRAEASLRDAASLLREAQAIAGLGSYTLNVSAGTWQSSEVMDRVLGLDAKSDRSVAGWLALIHPEDQAPLRDYLLHTVLEQGAPFDREYRIIRQSDQSERWVWGLGKLERDAAGHIVRMNGTIQDITERKRSQLELEHQSHLRAALLEMPAAAESMDEMAFLQHGQELAENLTGSGISFIRFVPEDQSTVELTVRSRRTREQYDHVANGPHDPVHQAGLWADAVRERRPVMLNHAPSPADHPGLPDGPAELTRLLVIPVVENNRVVMVAGVGNKPTDYLEVDLHRMQLISESLWRLMQRRRTKAQLQKLSRVVEQSPTSIVITDLGGSIEYVNPWFSTLTGYSAKDMLGQNPRVLKSGKTPPEVYGDMWRTLTAGRTWRGELINRKKNGEIYAELAVIAPVFGTDGKPTHYVAIKDDITARKQDELKLAAKEREQRLLIDHLSSGLIVYEADAGVVQTNPMAEAMLGLDAAAMLGK